MDGNSVRNLYALGHARWYDYFKKVWNRLVGTQAEEELRIFLQENVHKNTRILELGCGTALNLEKISSLHLKFKKYVGLDFSPDMLAIAKSKFANVKQVTFQQKDIIQLQDIHEKFDIIISTWVLSHLPSPSQVVNDAQALLAPHGKMSLIFFSKPKWFVNPWFYPIAKYIFKAKPVSEEEVKRFKNIITKRQFSANITTTMLISH